MYDNPLYREIVAQPAACHAVLDDVRVGKMLDGLAGEISVKGRLLVTGMGASYHAGEILASTLRQAGYEAWSVPTSELIHYGLQAIQSPLLIISQSGASAEVVLLLEHIRSNGPVRGLCLDPDSPLAQAVGCTLPGGIETPFAATRSFSATVTALLRLAKSLNAPVGTLEDGIDAMSHVLSAGVESLRLIVHQLRDCHALVVSGRGPLAGLANAAALLLMEVSRIPTLGLEAAQLRHGPIEMLSKDTGVLLLNAAGPTSDLIERLHDDIQHTGSRVALFDTSDRRSGTDSPYIQQVKTTERLPESVASLPLIALVQLLAFELALTRNIEPGTPLRSHKITREE